MTERVARSAVVVSRVVPDLWRVYRGVRLAMLLDSPLAFDSTFGREVALTDQQWRDRIQGSTAWLAFEGDLPVGAVTLYRYPEQEADEACLVAMWVAPHARGRGVADLLVRTLLDHARQAGLRRVTLDVADGNDRAIGCYQRLGFAPTGRTGALAHRADITELELERVLSELPAEPR